MSSALAQPFQLNGLTLPNRIVMAPMTRDACPNGVPTPEVAAYYARRAAGGAGLLITEGTVIDAQGAARSTTVPRFYGEDALAGWRAVVEAVHAEGGLIMPQLWHVGGDRQPGEGFDPDLPSISPDGGPDMQRLTREGIADLVESFGFAAQTAFKLGFDGIELHGAHGYLLDQFLWTESNHRDDEYGGSASARARFCAEVVARCRLLTSPEFPIIFRFSQWKVTDFTAKIAESPTELADLLAPLANAGVDAFHCSTRRFWEPAFPGCPETLAALTKRLTGKPVIAVGSVGLSGEFTESLVNGSGAKVVSLATAEEQVAAGSIDLLAVGRSILQDANWPAKVLQGRRDELQAFDAASMAVLS